jgi:pyruvate dehydrogenase E2 component (dihydrolipoamide acetyltransferase)
MLLLQMADSAAAAAVQGGTKGGARIEEPSRAQQAIARRAAESRATIPHLELAVEVDMAAALAARGSQSHSLTAIAAHACALALRDVPRANGAYRDARFELYPRVNVAVAVYTDEAFVLPTVFDADQKPLGQLTEELERLTARAASGELTPPELAGSTFTLWDLGPHGMAAGAPVIVPSQAAAVATGAVREIPVVRGGQVVAGQVMTVTLACDHRILYGSQAAWFLAAIKSHLEEGV